MPSLISAPSRLRGNGEDLTFTSELADMAISRSSIRLSRPQLLAKGTTSEEVFNFDFEGHEFQFERMISCSSEKNAKAVNRGSELMNLIKCVRKKCTN